MGGGALRDIGVYPCVTTRFATGAEPIAAKAEIDWQDGIDASAWARLDFPEFRLDFYVSMRLGPRQVMTFHGDRGWLSLTAPFNAGSYGDPVIEIRNEMNATQTLRFPRSDQYKAQIDAFNATVLDGRPFPARWVLPREPGRDRHDLCGRRSRPIKLAESSGGINP